MVFRAPRIVSRSCSGGRPASVFELVAPWPMNSQPRFFISSIALGKTSQTCEFNATVALTPAASNTSAMRHRPTRIPYLIRGIGGDADAEGGIVLPDLHVGREPDRKHVVARP